MGDLRYALTIVGTMIQGYFNRDDAFEELLSRYNDDFPERNDISKRLYKTFSFIDECGLNSKSRVWKKGDLLTLIVELDRIINLDNAVLSPSETVERLEHFYAATDEAGLGGRPLYSTYYKAALQASNDRINRMRRGFIINGVLLGQAESEITEKLEHEGW